MLDADTITRNKFIFVVDWDGTVLPLIELFKDGLLSSRDGAVQLQAHIQAALELMQFMLQHGVLVILTNSSDGWVVQSQNRYMPGLGALLDYCHILSARTLYGNEFPDDHLMWKWATLWTHVLPFLDQDAGPTQTPFHIIGLGDAPHDREIMLRLARDTAIDAAVEQVTSVLFLPKSTIPQLTSQLRQAHHLLSGIVGNNGAHNTFPWQTQMMPYGTTDTRVPFYDFSFQLDDDRITPLLQNDAILQPPELPFSSWETDAAAADDGTFDEQDSPFAVKQRQTRSFGSQPAFPWLYVRP